MGLALFFCGNLLASFGDDQLSILLSQLPILGIAGQSGLHLRKLIGWHIARCVFTVFPVLELVVGTGGTGAFFEGIG